MPPDYDVLTELDSWYKKRTPEDRRHWSICPLDKYSYIVRLTLLYNYDIFTIQECAHTVAMACYCALQKFSHWEKYNGSKKEDQKS